MDRHNAQILCSGGTDFSEKKSEQYWNIYKQMFLIINYTLSVLDSMHNVHNEPNPDKMFYLIFLPIRWLS